MKKQGRIRFEFQLEKIEMLVNQAINHENPALWLFVHDLRTPFFMLEGLAKMYAKLHNEKSFTKLREQFKAIEDALGAVDFYAAFSKEFDADKNISLEIKLYFQTKTKEKIQNLQQILKKEDWLDGSRIKKIRKKLDELDWLKSEKETEAIQGFYKAEIKKINQFINENSTGFDDIEAQVHELRRKLRWLSIYPQGLQGKIVLKESKETTHLKPYLTASVLASPFNQFPINEDLISKVYLDKNNFLALSWMIAELGKIKDKGLKINALKDAIQEIKLINDEKAMAETMTFLPKNTSTISSLLKESSHLMKQFKADAILDNLLIVS
jgi:hypothetical protein